MGVDAKLVVVCKDEEKMNVMELILLAVEQCANLELRSKALSCNLLLQDILSLKDEVYMRSTEMSTYNFRTFTIKFGIGDKYERQADEAAPIGLILCAQAGTEQVELMNLQKDNIMVAEYWTELPPKAVLEEKLHTALIEIRERLAEQKHIAKS